MYRLLYSSYFINTAVSSFCFLLYHVVALAFYYKVYFVLLYLHKKVLLSAYRKHTQDYGLWHLFLRAVFYLLAVIFFISLTPSFEQQALDTSWIFHNSWKKKKKKCIYCRFGENMLEGAFHPHQVHFTHSSLRWSMQVHVNKKFATLLCCFVQNTVHVSDELLHLFIHKSACLNKSIARLRFFFFHLAL